ncbi:MAG: heme-binding protein [Sneathiellales bacterium]|nr:heme-binding protein [Sneathiellales bacterium]
MKTPTKQILAGAFACAATAFLINPAIASDDEEALVSFKTLSPGTALELAEAALEACREADYQVAVAVVDRFGILQALLRDRYAGSHTPDTATRKAWTSVSFRTNTLALADSTQAGKEASGIRNVTNALMVGGGVQVTAAGALVGGIGVSGAPSGEADDECAKAGIEQISDKLDF